MSAGKPFDPILDVVVDTIKNHIPSISDEDESDIDDRAREYVVAMNEEVDAADLAQRTCHCGMKIEGYYDYVAHLITVFGGDPSKPRGQ